MDNVFINLNDPVFLIEPDIRFAKRMQVPLGFWKDMYQRKNFWGYSEKELSEWFEFKTKGRKISNKALYRWLVRQDVYNTAQTLIKRGEKTVHIKYFNKHQEFLKSYTTDKPCIIDNEEV